MCLESVSIRIKRPPPGVLPVDGVGIVADRSPRAQPRPFPISLTCNASARHPVQGIDSLYDSRAAPRGPVRRRTPFRANHVLHHREPKVDQVAVARYQHPFQVVEHRCRTTASGRYDGRCCLRTKPKRDVVYVQVLASSSFRVKSPADGATVLRSALARLAGSCPTRTTVRFPPDIVVSIKALACELPRESGLPLSRYSTSGIASEASRRGIVADISGATHGSSRAGSPLPRRRRDRARPRATRGSEPFKHGSRISETPRITNFHCRSCFF